MRAPKKPGSLKGDGLQGEMKGHFTYFRLTIESSFTLLYLRGPLTPALAIHDSENSLAESIERNISASFAL